MSYYLGFDGGGTKTDCVLLDHGGKVLCQARGGPSNPMRAGYPRAWFALSAAADTVLARHSLKAKDIRGVCAGLGGAGRPTVARKVGAFFEQSFPMAEVKVTTDLAVALAAVAEAGPALILVAGTGSAAYGRNAAGKIVRAGGWGPWLGDEGSAFEIGRSALAAVRRHEDGMGPATILSGRFLKTLDSRDWNAVLERIAKNPDDVFPRMFPLVAEAAEDGDDVSRKILLGAAGSLAELAAHAIEKLDLAESAFPLVRVGGVFGHSAFLDTLVEERLRELAPRASVGMLQSSPAIAAAHMARAAALRKPEASQPSESH